MTLLRDLREDQPRRPPARCTPTVGFVARAEPGVTGTSRYAATLMRELHSSGIDVRLAPPAMPTVLRGAARWFRRFGPDGERFLETYPVSVPKLEVDLYHLTSQNLATALLFQRFDRPVVVTVHDIIPYLVRRDPRLNTYAHPAHRLFDYLAMRGLRRADRLVTVSEWTRRTLIEALGISAHRIDAVHSGVDHERFKPMAVPDGFRSRYGLGADRRYVLTVGSEDPRKNLESLVGAVALVRRKLDDVILLKVGSGHHAKERPRLRALATSLHVDEAIRWFDDVPEEDLPLFYNAASVFVMPSRYEGFGFPVLEAMACGTPVICSRASSLDELAGDVAATCKPVAVEIAAAIEARFAAGDRADRSAILDWAARFTWSGAAAGTAAAYRSALAASRPGGRR